MTVDRFEVLDAPLKGGWATRRDRQTTQRVLFLEHRRFLPIERFAHRAAAARALGSPFLPGAPAKPVGPRVPRNALCACGSGKKSKRCCAA